GVLLLALCQGCVITPKGTPGAGCPPPAQTGEGAAIHVKAPPQKIYIEQAECAPPGEEAGKGKPESAPEKKESRPESRGRPESERERERPRETREGRPEAAVERPESALGALSALGQIASLSRTTALTSSLGTVNPGSSCLGIGIQWIRIPIPLPRLFRVDETPSVTVPLNEASLMPVGYGGAGYADLL